MKSKLLEKLPGGFYFFAGFHNYPEYSGENMVVVFVCDLYVQKLCSRWQGVVGCNFDHAFAHDVELCGDAGSDVVARYPVDALGDGESPVRAFYLRGLPRGFVIKGNTIGCCGVERPDYEAIGAV